MGFSQRTGRVQSTDGLGVITVAPSGWRAAINQRAFRVVRRHNRSGAGNWRLPNNAHRVPVGRALGTTVDRSPVHTPTTPTADPAGMPLAPRSHTVAPEIGRASCR